ncbi:MAG: hypothetical protein QW474_01165 [Candidatus Aenigmatarchaeota archaeon]
MIRKQFDFKSGKQRYWFFKIKEPYLIFKITAIGKYIFYGSMPEDYVFPKGFYELTTLHIPFLIWNINTNEFWTINNNADIYINIKILRELVFGEDEDKYAY